MTAVRCIDRAPAPVAPPCPPTPTVPVLFGEIITPGDRTIRVVARYNPFTTETIDKSFQAGATLAELLVAVQPDPRRRPFATIFIDDWKIPEEYWHLIRPKPGRTVTICVLPTGGGKKNIFRLVLTLAVLAASIFAPPLLLGQAAAGAYIIGTAAAGGITMGAAVSAAIFVAPAPALLSCLRFPRRER